MLIANHSLTNVAGLSTTGNGKKKDPLSAKDLQAKIFFLIKDGAQKDYSVDYIAEEIQKMVKASPIATGKLGLSADFLTIKKMVFAQYDRAKSVVGQEQATK